MAEFIEVFSNNLRDILNEKGMTQEELGVRSGISRQTINKYVNGKVIPRGVNVRRLVRALECDISDLLGYE